MARRRDTAVVSDFLDETAVGNKSGLFVPAAVLPSYLCGLRPAALLPQSSSCAGGTTATGAECSSADGVADDPYEPGQAVGVGIKAEMWKTKHPNLTVLETGEDTPVLVRVVCLLP